MLAHLPARTFTLTNTESVLFVHVFVCLRNWYDANENIRIDGIFMHSNGLNVWCMVNRYKHSTRKTTATITTDHFHSNKSTFIHLFTVFECSMLLWHRKYAHSAPAKLPPKRTARKKGAALNLKMQSALVIILYGFIRDNVFLCVLCIQSGG